MTKARCKLCNDTIESTSESDWVQCTCSKLRLKGSRAQFEFLEDVCFIDENGTEREGYTKPVHRPTKAELLDMLDDMNERIEDLPPNAGVSPITHYDFSALLLLLSAIFRAD